MKHRLSSIIAVVAFSMLLGISASATTTASGEMLVSVGGPIVDLGPIVGDDSGQILGSSVGVVVPVPDPGVFGGLTVATLYGFDYTPGAFAAGAPVDILESGRWLVRGVEILSVAETATALTDEVTLLGTGTLIDTIGAYADTAIDWELQANTNVLNSSVFRIVTENAGGNGTGALPIPEPTSAVAFVTGLVLLGGSLRRRRS